MGPLSLKPRVPVAKDYFELITAEAATIPESYGDDPLRPERFRRAAAMRGQIAEELRSSTEVSLVRVFELEALQTRLLTDERIKTKAWSVRASYTALISKEMLQKYIESRPPELKNIEGEEVARVRADVEDLMSGLHWWYVNADRKERALRRLKGELLIAVLAGLVFVLLMTGALSIRSGGVGTLLSHLTPLEMIAYVMYAGLLGAVTSTIRRIQPVADEPVSASDPLIKSMALDQGNVGVALSAGLGAVFAMVLYLMFAAGLNDAIGNAAPQFVASVEGRTCCGFSLYEYFCALLPKRSSDFAKMLVWGFAAGFAERLVPDMLDRLQATKPK